MTRTALLLGFVTLTACADSPPPVAAEPAPAPTPPPATAAVPTATAPVVPAVPEVKLPAAIATSKRIRVGSDVSDPPLESYDGKEAKGFEVDLCGVLAKKIGPDVACDFVNDEFDKLLDDLAAGKFDVVMSAMTDTKERQAKVDYVDYLSAGMSVVVKKGNPLKLKSLDDLCGKSLGAQKGTTEEAFAAKQKDACAKAKKKPLKVVTVVADTESMAMLRAGKLAADLEDYPAASYAAKTSGGGNDFELFGTPADVAPYGIAVGKSNGDLRDALAAALKAAQADGSYTALVTKWGLDQGALTGAPINGGQ